MLQYQKIDFSGGIDVKIKQVHRKKLSFVTIGFLKMLDLNLKTMFVIDFIIY